MVVTTEKWQCNAMHVASMKFNVTCGIVVSLKVCGVCKGLRLSYKLKKKEFQPQIAEIQKSVYLSMT